jgi:NAD(P)-dependent dehydrogenase (short-subunit alcohol dehydrogenase family)
MIRNTSKLPATDSPIRRVGTISVGMALCLVLSAGALPAAAATPVSAATASKAAVTAFKNCTALNAKHPGGVAKTGIKVNLVNGKKRAFTKRPIFSNALYAANKKSDRDKDGIACEH